MYWKMCKFYLKTYWKMWELEKKTKLRIVKLWENRFMVQKKWMWITPSSSWALVPARANELKEPVDYETAMAYIEMYRPEKEKEVVYEVEF